MMRTCYEAFCTFLLKIWCTSPSTFKLPAMFLAFFFVRHPTGLYTYKMNMIAIPNLAYDASSVSISKRLVLGTLAASCRIIVTLIVIVPSSLLVIISLETVPGLQYLVTPQQTPRCTVLFVHEPFEHTLYPVSKTTSLQ